METPDLVFEPLPGEALNRFLRENIISVNIAATGRSEWHPIGYFLKTQRGEWVGGLTGYIWGDWLHVDLLWVTRLLRGQAQGTRLINAAEELAAQRGATAATLETHSFQALGFYQKRGYTVFGQLDDYPPGHTKFFLRKDLGRRSGAQPQASESEPNSIGGGSSSVART